MKRIGSRLAVLAFVTMNHQPESPDPDLQAAFMMLGAVISGKWAVQRLLGSGGMAAVYAATHVNNARRVALKILHPSIAGIDEVRERFLEEAYAANRIDHPGTVKALDDGFLDDGRPYLVLDLLEGESLEAVSERAEGGLPPPEVLRIVDELLDVVEAAHDQGILHRDIKPENVFISTDGSVKLLDFGIAKMADSRRVFKTRVGDAMGTPSFMPPEQARGRWADVDERSDLWAVTATVFTLLAGRTVHQGETTNEVLLSAMTRRAPSLQSVVSHLPERIVAFVDKGLAYEKEARFQSASEMRAELRACLEEWSRISSPPESGVRTRSTFIPYMIRSSLRFGRTWFGVGAVTAVLAISTLLIAPPTTASPVTNATWDESLAALGATTRRIELPWDPVLERTPGGPLRGTLVQSAVAHDVFPDDGSANGTIGLSARDPVLIDVEAANVPSPFAEQTAAATADEVLSRNP